MCGFAGILNSSTTFNSRQIYEIASKVAFRGPDSTNVIVLDENIRNSDSGCSALFFNRLAIIDLDPRSNQPFGNERYTLLFNGEIYNYKNLKKQLKDQGETFITESDTEVLFKLLIKEGSKCINSLNGMFAFFFLDRNTGEFIIARDRVGIKPLYYRIEDSSIIFGSEADSIIRFSDKNKRINFEAINWYLMLQYIPTPLTIYDNIWKLPPGCFIQSSINELKNQKAVKPQIYWDAYNVIREAKYDPNGDLESLLTDSLNIQLNSDVPLGLFLSSGIDSSLLAAVINKHFNNNLYNFYTVAFYESTDKDESIDAQQFIKGFNNSNFRHHKLVLAQQDLIMAFNELYVYTDEPFGDNAVLLNYAISKKAKEHVTVALSGDGGDELFWGYTRYNEFQKYKFHPIKNIAQKILSSFSNNFNNDPIYRYWRSVSSNYFLDYNIVNTNELWWNKGFTFNKRKDLPYIVDLKSYLPDCMFYKVDRSSMGTSLEVRVPLLDNYIIDYALSLPLDQKSNDYYSSKAPLKRMLKKLAPHYNFSLPKKGFGFPLDKWLRNDFKDDVLNLINNIHFNDLGLEEGIKKMIVDFYNKKNNEVYTIWYIFNLLKWYKQKASF